MLFGIYSARGVLDGWSGSGWHGGSLIKFRLAGSRALASYGGSELKSHWLWVAMGYGRGFFIGDGETTRQIFD